MIMDKKKLRKWAKAQGKFREACSQNVIKELRASEIYKQAHNILIFYPLEGEVNLLELLDDKDKNFYLPRIEGKNLLCCPFKKGDELCLSCFKTQEPVSDEVEKNQIDFAIIPALCCDKNNYRLGYGGGFYDRFLVGFSGKKIVCLPKELIVETIYPDEFDVPVDFVFCV